MCKIMSQNIIKLISVILICVSIPSAALLDGYYQVTSLTIITNGKPKGFNNTDLYIWAGERRVNIVGAWRGFPMKRSAVIERTVGDTLVLRDMENQAIPYKFHIRGNKINGRHVLNYDDGTSGIIETKAVVKKLNQGEINRIKSRNLFN